MAFIWGEFRKRYLSHQSQKLAWNYLPKIKLKYPRGQWVKVIWVRSRKCGCLVDVTRLFYQLIAKPGNKTTAHPCPDSNVWKTLSNAFSWMKLVSVLSLVQAMAWHQTGLYQWWSNSVMPYGISGPQWVKKNVKRTLTLKWLVILFKVLFHSLNMFTINTTPLCESGPVQCIFNQLCGYWWPGWCFSTRASVGIVLRTQSWVSRHVRVNYYQNYSAHEGLGFIEQFLAYVLLKSLFWWSAL